MTRLSLSRPAVRRGAGSIVIILAAGLAMASAAAHAAGSGMPWEQPLEQVLESVQGPVAKIVAVIIIITTGLPLAFGAASGGFRRLIQKIGRGARGESGGQNGRISGVGG